MQVKNIRTHEASLDTLSVSVLAIHVNQKQMTLAVFRQLPVSGIHNADGTLDDKEYWGVVRYHIKDEDCNRWVIISDNGILYRCPYYSRVASAVSYGECNRIALEAEKLYKEYSDWMETVRVHELDESSHREMCLRPYCHIPVQRSYRDGFVRGRSFETTNREDRIYLEVCLNADLTKALKARIVSSHQFDSGKFLCDLPQLFIAV